MPLRSSGPLATDQSRAIVDACRATIGDQMRSLTYFPNDDFEQRYLRTDLEAEADLTGFVEHESNGFDAHAAYHGSELGEYKFTSQRL